MVMILRFLVLILLFVCLTPDYSIAEEDDNTITIEGEASVVVKPDIAHFFLRVTGDGENYDASNKAAKEKISQLTGILKTILNETPELAILRVENKPKGKSMEDMYQKEFIEGMAKAIKGEIPDEEHPKKKEMTTTITIYFSLSKFSDESKLELMNTLADKEIAFDKRSEYDFDFSIEYDPDKSAIFYGVMNPDKYLVELSTEAFKKAQEQAKIISQAAGKKLGSLVNISGCGETIKGTVNLSDRFNLTGKDLGPLSVDSSRLIITFNKDFGFRIE